MSNKTSDINVANEERLNNFIEAYKQQEEMDKKDKIIDFYKKGLEREIESNRENVMEIIKKDKQIDLMADKLVEAHEWFYSEFDNFTKEDFIKYFADKAKGQ